MSYHFYIVNTIVFVKFNYLFTNKKLCDDYIFNDAAIQIANHDFKCRYCSEEERRRNVSNYANDSVEK